MSPADRLRSIANGDLTIAGQSVECHVLSDGRRVLDTSQAQAFLGLGAKDRHFWRSLARIPGLSAEIQAGPRIAFVLPDGRSVAYGYEASFIMDVCLAYQAAFLKDALHHKQAPTARRAMSMVAAAAKVGLEALIDEATGYQKRRPGDYLRGRFSDLLRDHHDDWKRRWNDDLMDALCRLYGRRHVPGTPPPRCLWRAEGMIYDLVIGPDVMAEVRRRNPEPEHGTNHHQLFRDPVQSLLGDDLRVILALAQTAATKRDFWHHMRVHYCREPLQLRLPN